jgi:peroxiredoxin
MALKVGEPAPTPVLFSAPRTPFPLSDHIGKQPVLLLFFPLAFSSTCTAEMCTVSDDFGAYSGLNAAVFAISVDSPYVNDKFTKETGARFPILSDFNREAIRAYDVVRPDLGGLRDVSERVVFVIGRDGRVRYVWQGEHPGVMPPFDEIKKEVEQAG